MSAAALSVPVLHGVDPRRAPISIYAVDAGSWDRDAAGEPLGWEALADRLVPYVADLGFTHVELMPIAVDDGFAGFVEAAHRAGIGVLLGWDAAGDSGCDLGRDEERRRLVADALRWTGERGVDGLKLEAVGALLYRDYGRHAEASAPGDRGRWDAVEFLRSLNRTVHADCPACLTVAEESTAWPCITNPAQAGGLGFDFKANLCWRYDMLDYFGRDPGERPGHHRAVTAGLSYAYAENFILPLGHDEAAPDRGLVARMAGDDREQFANLRALYALMWGHPGKKLLFMGQEFAQRRGWDATGALDWGLGGHHAHDSVLALVRDLNRLYRTHPALHARDCESDGFAWLVEEDAEHAVFAWVRHAPGAPPVAVVANLLPVARAPYRLPLPVDGRWREILTTDAAAYGGTNLVNGTVDARDGAAWITLPPLATIMLEAPC